MRLVELILAEDQLQRFVACEELAQLDTALVRGVDFGLVLKHLAFVVGT